MRTLAVLLRLHAWGVSRWIPFSSAPVTRVSSKRYTLFEIELSLKSFLFMDKRMKTEIMAFQMLLSFNVLVSDLDLILMNLVKQFYENVSESFPSEICLLLCQLDGKIKSEW